MTKITEDTFFEDPKSALSTVYPSAYLASWSAAEVWELIDECTRDITLFSVDFEKDEIKDFYGVPVILKKISSAQNWGIVEKESDQGSYKVSDIHKTLIDCLLNVDLAGGEDQVKDMFLNYKNHPDSRVDTLISYAKKMNNPSIVSKIVKMMQRV